MTTIRPLSAALLAATLLAAAPPLSAAEHLVILQGHEFVPAQLDIQAGDTVRWTNQSALPHNVRADDDSFRCAATCREDSSGGGGYPTEPNGGAPSAAAWSYTRSFGTPGEVPYYCEAHGSTGGVGMAGNVTVLAVDPPPFAINQGTSGSWYNPVTSGQGFFLDVIPGETPLMVIAWFTFDTAPGDVETQRWYTGLGSYEEGADAVALTLYRTTGGVIDQAEPAVTTVETGSATLRFDSCIAGSFTYELVLATGTINNDISIERLTSPALCEALRTAP